MVASMAYAFQQYYVTRNRTLSGGGHPWPTNTALWPTFMVLTIATITMLMNLITMCFYCCGVDAANRSNQIMGYVGYAVMALHAVVWAVTTGLFKMASNIGNDLYGFSCGAEADRIQAQVESYLNFNNLCMIQVCSTSPPTRSLLISLLQTGTWIVTIVETISYIVLIMIYIYAARRAMHKLQLNHFQQRMSSQAF